MRAMHHAHLPQLSLLHFQVTKKVAIYLIFILLQRALLLGFTVLQHHHASCNYDSYHLTKNRCLINIFCEINIKIERTGNHYDEVTQLLLGSWMIGMKCYNYALLI